MNYNISRAFSAGVMMGNVKVFSGSITKKSIDCQYIHADGDSNLYGKEKQTGERILIGDISVNDGTYKVRIFNDTIPEIDTSKSEIDKMEEILHSIGISTDEIEEILNLLRVRERTER